MSVPANEVSGSITQVEHLEFQKLLWGRSSAPLELAANSVPELLLTLTYDEPQSLDRLRVQTESRYVLQPTTFTDVIWRVLGKLRSSGAENSLVSYIDILSLETRPIFCRSPASI